MAKLNGNLDRALRKARPFSDTKEWCAAFTPSEILALIKDGHKPTAHQEQKVNHAKIYVAKGESSPMWFYFYSTGKNRPYFIKDNKHDKTQ